MPQEINSLRIVVRPHLNRRVVEILAEDIERACEYLEVQGGNATPPKTAGVAQDICSQVLNWRVQGTPG